MGEVRASNAVNPLHILVENLGRGNYGYGLYDPKGVGGGFRLGYQYQTNVTQWPLAMDNLQQLTTKGLWRPLSTSARAKATNGRKQHYSPAWYRGTFTLSSAPADTFLQLDGWTKGNVWINGFHLGRYWNVGPQFTLYVPSPILHAAPSLNEVIVWESSDLIAPIIQFRTTPIWR